MDICYGLHIIYNLHNRVFTGAGVSGSIMKEGG